MKSKELKVVIKEMVRESLMEIFAEMHLENIVENVVKKQRPVMTAQPRYITEEIEDEPQPRSQVQKKPQVSVESQKKKLQEDLKRKLGVSDSEWRAIYEGVTPAASDEGSNVNVESVSEEALESMGLMRDYSEHIK